MFGYKSSEWRHFKNRDTKKHDIKFVRFCYVVQFNKFVLKKSKCETNTVCNLGNKQNNHIYSVLAYKKSHKSFKLILNVCGYLNCIV